MRKLNRKGVVVTAAATTVVLMGGAGAYAAHDANTIHGCHDTRSGVLRVADTCRATETAIEWNKQGPQGPAGPIGPQGPQGEPGPQGPAGATQAYHAELVFGRFGPTTRFLSLDLPAGTYLVTGKTYITSSGYGSCRLVSGEEQWQNYHDGASFESNTVRWAAVMIDKITLTEPAQVAIRCGANGLDEWETRNSVLTAVPVT